MRNAKGFTLIELVVVIVILGILSATALPKFIDLSSDAGNAAANGVAGALASASATNYGAQVAGNAGTAGLSAAANVCTAAILGNFINGVSLSTAAGNSVSNSEFNVQGTGNCGTSVAPGTAVTCQITGSKGVAQTATIICGKTS